MTTTIFPWPTDVPRIFGASVAAIHESAHYYRRARHARPSRRQVRRAIVTQATAAAIRDRADEARRDREWTRLVQAVTA